MIRAYPTTFDVTVFVPVRIALVVVESGVIPAEITAVTIPESADGALVGTVEDTARRPRRRAPWDR